MDDFFTAILVTLLITAPAILLIALWSFWK